MDEASFEKFKESTGGSMSEVRIEHSHKFNLLRIMIPIGKGEAACLVLREEDFQGFVTSVMEQAYELGWKGVMLAKDAPQSIINLLDDKDYKSVSPSDN